MNKTFCTYLLIIKKWLCRLLCKTSQRVSVTRFTKLLYFFLIGAAILITISMKGHIWVTFIHILLPILVSNVSELIEMSSKNKIIKLDFLVKTYNYSRGNISISIKPINICIKISPIDASYFIDFNARTSICCAALDV